MWPSGYNLSSRLSDAEFDSAVSYYNYCTAVTDWSCCRMLTLKLFKLSVPPSVAPCYVHIQSVSVSMEIVIQYLSYILYLSRSLHEASFACLSHSQVQALLSTIHIYILFYLIGPRSRYASHFQVSRSQVQAPSSVSTFKCFGVAHSARINFAAAKSPSLPFFSLINFSSCLTATAFSFSLPFFCFLTATTIPHHPLI